MERRGGRYYGRREDEHSATEKPKTKIIPSLSPRGAKFTQVLSSDIIPCDEITVSLHNFPYFIQEHSQSLLVECVASNLKQNRLRKFTAGFKSSSQRIRLKTIPGAELFRERLVSAVASELNVPLLRLDAAYGCDEEKDRRDAEESYNQGGEFKKGDRVKYSGSNSISFEEVNNRTLVCGQRGEVYEVKGNTAAVVFNICGLIKWEAEKEEKNTDILRQSLVVWLHVSDVMKDNEVRTHDCYIAMEALCVVLESLHPLIVYFPDYFLWPSSCHEDEVPWMNIFNQLPEGVVMICAENYSFRHMIGIKMAKALEQYQERLHGFPESTKIMKKIFTNVVCIKPPVDEDLANTFVTQIEGQTEEEDSSKVISDSNFKIMHKVLKDHNLSCINLENLNYLLKDMILTNEQAKKILGWALNHCFSSCPVPCVNEEILHIPHDSIKLAISRLKEEEAFMSRPLNKPKKESNSFQDLNSEYFTSWLASASFRPEDIHVKFDELYAPENVKKLLRQTVIFPMRMPELFSYENLLTPCKGILLFGPSGTGKTNIVKALAKESGANLFNVTVANFTHMVDENHGFNFLGQPWERELFSHANKLAPVIIFLDEVDSMLGAGGCDTFLRAWDGLDCQETQRILVIGSTNRPFDLDEAVIHRMPRRIYVGLPDLENRSKILKCILNKENLESGFSFDLLAEATEGYSWSDLKNLCIVAAYRPIEEFAEQESKGEASDEVSALRPLKLNDFIHSKAKVRPSVAEDATMMMRKWNEQYGEGESQW